MLVPASYLMSVLFTPHYPLNPAHLGTHDHQTLPLTHHTWLTRFPQGLLHSWLGVGKDLYFPDMKPFPMPAPMVIEAASPYFTCSLAPLSFQPVAAGSGIPQIKCFLNGVKIPHVVRLKVRCAARQGGACMGFLLG